MAPPAFLNVFDIHGGLSRVNPDDEPRIDAAVTQYLTTQRDGLVWVTSIEGETFKMRASAISCWFLSTPESRRKGQEFDRALDAEHAEIEEELRDTYGPQPWEDAEPWK